MKVFYNREGIGDCLIISLGDGEMTAEEKQFRTFNRRDDAVRIFREDTDETLGYNLFSASAYLTVDEQGQLEVTEQLLDGINKALQKNGYEERVTADLSPKFVVGFILEKNKHENADKLSVCKVDVGEEVLQIVCGAPNVEAGQKVVVAKVGAIMPSGMAIKDAELRGVPSSGMICSARELNIPNAPQEKGILVLSKDHEPGKPFTF